MPAPVFIDYSNRYGMTRNPACYNCTHISYAVLNCECWIALRLETEYCTLGNVIITDGIVPPQDTLVTA